MKINLIVIFKGEMREIGEFRSGVSICSNKGTQLDLGAPFLLGAPPGRGYRVAHSPALTLRPQTQKRFSHFLAVTLYLDSLW